mmetsp:Transcript_39940/g.29453  ORF Transcript_39940/g.29453 Transcript_39940/m.29453 type:complete len:89 (+) Transcript_39940:437-703(+)
MKMILQIPNVTCKHGQKFTNNDIVELLNFDGYLDLRSTYNVAELPGGNPEMLISSGYFKNKTLHCGCGRKIKLDKIEVKNVNSKVNCE